MGNNGFNFCGFGNYVSAEREILQSKTTNWQSEKALGDAGPAAGKPGRAENNDLPGEVINKIEVTAKDGKRQTSQGNGMTLIWARQACHPGVEIICNKLIVENYPAGSKTR